LQQAFLDNEPGVNKQLVATAQAILASEFKGALSEKTVFNLEEAIRFMTPGTPAPESATTNFTGGVTNWPKPGPEVDDFKYVEVSGTSLNAASTPCSTSSALLEAVEKADERSHMIQHADRLIRRLHEDLEPEDSAKYIEQAHKFIATAPKNGVFDTKIRELGYAIRFQGGKVDE
jgi:hypothetical protein